MNVQNSPPANYQLSVVAHDNNNRVEHKCVEAITIFGNASNFRNGYIDHPLFSKIGSFVIQRHNRNYKCRLMDVEALWINKEKVLHTGKSFDVKIGDEIMFSATYEDHNFKLVIELSTEDEISPSQAPITSKRSALKLPNLPKAKKVRIEEAVENGNSVRRRLFEGVPVERKISGLNVEPFRVRLPNTDVGAATSSAKQDTGSNQFEKTRKRVHSADAPIKVKLMRGPDINKFKKYEGMDATEENIKKCAKEVFGYENLRPRQLEMIIDAITGVSVIIVEAASFGKSFIYQIAALFRKGITLVVLPTLSLIEDLCKKLRAWQYPHVSYAGLKYISSAADLKAFAEVKLFAKLMIVTPEATTTNPSIKAVLGTYARLNKFNTCVADEAHMYVNAHQDYREDYDFLKFVANKYRTIVWICSTASGSKLVIADLRCDLHLENAILHRGPLNRPNIQYTVYRKVSDNGAIVEIVDQLRQKTDGKTLVFATTRDAVDDAVKEFRTHDMQILPYHAGINRTLRIANNEQWSAGQLDSMICSTAFGLGVDEPGVSTVWHISMPFSIDNLYQESSRSGRDRQEANSKVFWNENDIVVVDRTINKKTIKPLPPYVLERKINGAFGSKYYCQNEVDCLREIILFDLDDDVSILENDVLNCCGNCTEFFNNPNSYTTRDFRDHANIMLNELRVLSRKIGHLKLQDIRQLFKTSAQMCNCFRNWSENNIYRLFFFLVKKKFIKNVIVRLEDINYLTFVPGANVNYDDVVLVWCLAHKY